MPRYCELEGQDLLIDMLEPEGRLIELDMYSKTEEVGMNMNHTRQTCSWIIETRGIKKDEELKALCNFCRVRNKIVCVNKKLFKEMLKGVKNG